MPADNTTTTDDLPHLLVVDDSRLMRRAIGKILGKEYRITEAADGEEGWKILQEFDDIQVVFSDLSMPKLDGYGLLDRIRGSDNERLSKIPVIIITGAEDDEKTKQRALSSGASDFISKPFESVQLRSRAKTHVNLDATNRKLDETVSKLEQQATIDELTGLANKNSFYQRGNKDLAYCKRHRSELSLVRINIDNFNKHFTTFGKEPAEHILKEVSRVLLEGVRQEDTVARLGVAKLALLMPSTNRLGAKQKAERIRRQMEELPIEFGGISIEVTISAGVAALAIQKDTTLENFIKMADANVNAAIAAGGNRVALDTQLTEAPVTDEEKAALATDKPAVVTTEPNEDVELPPLADEPDLDTAIKIATSAEAYRIHPHLVALLRRLLPLIELCNAKLDLGIDDAIKKIRQKTGN